MKAKIIPIKSRLFRINKTNKKRQRLSDNKFRDLGYIIRANDRTRYISGKALDVATNFHKMLQRHPEKRAFVDQAFLSNITKVTTSGGNANIMWQLDDIYVRKYHDAVYFDGKIKRWGYIVSYTEDGEERMNNPSKFYKMDSLFRPDTNSDLGANKLRPRSQKILTLSIYKELIEDSSYRAISSINEEKAMEESISASQAKLNETSPDAALPLGGSITGEFLPHSPKPRLVITAAMQTGTAPIPQLPQASGLGMGEVSTATDNPSTPPPVLLPVLPSITPPPSMNAEQEREHIRQHQTRKQGASSDEPKPLGATILSLVQNLNLSANTQQKGVEFQLEIENSKVCSTHEHLIETSVAEEIEETQNDRNEELRQILAEKAERNGVWQGLLSRVAQALGETYDPITYKMREVTLEDMRGQFGSMNYKVDLESKHISLQAKGELWIPAFEHTYAAKFTDAATEGGYSFELVRTLEEKS